MKYKWNHRKIGREVGQIEDLDPSWRSVQLWVESGWIDPIDAPKPEPEPVAVSAVSAPPATTKVSTPAKRKVE